MSKEARWLIGGLTVLGLIPMIIAALLIRLVEESDIEARYRVTGSNIELIAGQEETWHASAWARVVELVPLEYRLNVGHFEAITGENDGEVKPDDDALNEWTLALADNQDPLTRDATIIHELGHLITLQPGQLRPAADDSEANCKTYFTGEGCAAIGSVFDLFVGRFWQVTHTDQVDPAAARDRYLAAPESFVTEYAATNPGEDIAETFVFFVYRSRPTPDTIAAEKINLLWEFPELIQLRASLRLRIDR